MYYLLIISLLSLLASPSFAVENEESESESYLIQVRRSMASDPEKAFRLAKKAEELSQEEGNRLTLAESNLLLGKLFANQAAYNQALSHLLYSLEIFDAEEELKLQAETLNELGSLYYFLGRSEKGLDQHRRALQLYFRVKDSLGVAATYGNIGHYYEKLSRYDSALIFQQKALDMLDTAKYPAHTSEIISHLGSIHEDLMHYDQARSFFVRSLQLNDSATHVQERIIILNNLGDIALKQQLYAEAEGLMRRSLALARLQKNYYQIRSALRDLSQLYAARNDHETAYAYLDSSVSFYKKIYSEEGLKQVAQLEAFFEAEKKEKEIRLLEKDRRISQLIISLVLAGLLSFVVIGMMLYHRQQQDLRQKQELFAAQEKYMNAQLENKDRSLTSYSLHLMEKNQLLQQLQDELKSISRNGGDNPKRQLRSLSRDIDLNLSHEKDWESFRLAFEAVHPSFFRRLSQRHARLTHADLKLAALMKMHLDSREIAAILHISTDSLRVARYRLRKKLKLEKDLKLTSYLHAL